MDKPKTPWVTKFVATVFDAAPWMTVNKEHVAFPNGGEIEDFYQVILRHFALMVPITSDGKVVMVRGYRHGPGRSEFAFPGGFIDPGEAPDTAVSRELLE